ncbi:MAG: hypothetical protein Greene071421_365 [Parcubacteria group bacterium Greene0714_21]|nr:MAG: hypothetical protein Greene041639_19 [Parcubacteria group bacterium Greene0416_39]TSC98349.1 MAG: hypothetical protein Greene101447_92 [Parcubacteria group bacterium Greene1014_47]TSD03999.1 MAG: hypothetical protein Greene071421_365 [Parcubacteria group bacterium Greene0714_21]
MPELTSPQLQEVNEMLTQQLGPGEDLTEEEFQQIVTKSPNRPKFPLLILCMALLKDFGDLVTLGFLGMITNFFFGILIWVWLMGKLGFMRKWLYKRFIFVLMLEFFPFINMIPINTFFVVRAHMKECKKVDAILNALEGFAKQARRGKLSLQPA